MKDHDDIEFGGPATYSILVQGALSQDWSAQLADMTITVTDRGGRSPHTILTGRIRDQAQLSGVLDALYNLHMSIIKVEKINEQE